MRDLIKLLAACLYVTIIVTGCKNSSVSNDEPPNYWVGKIHTGTEDIPFRFFLTDTSLTLVNTEESILLSKTSSKGDTSNWSFPQYSGELVIYGRQRDSLWGVWNNAALPNEQFTFHAIGAAQPSEELLSVEHNRYYNVFFNDGVKAFGAFNFSDSVSTGTFLTETGDYRYLQGKRDGDHFWLSTFDGDHLYLAEGELTDTSIVNGKFYSRHKKPVLWNGIASEKSHLAHPDSLTQLKPSDEPIQFTVLNFQGKPVIFDSTAFRGNVTIVSLFGSWCPNCHDELRFHRDLHTDLNHPNLQFVPVAFERQEEVADAEKAVKRVFDALEISFDPYYGGKASKSEAGKTFPMLDKVRAFPTSLVIDKNGVVRKIHTGFSGPGTGQFYDQHKTETTRLLKKLLKE